MLRDLDSIQFIIHEVVGMANELEAQLEVLGDFFAVLSALGLFSVGYEVVNHWDGLL